MFERLTPAGRQACDSAGREACAAGVGVIGPEHLLMAAVDVSWKLGEPRLRDALPTGVLQAEQTGATITFEQVAA